MKGLIQDDEIEACVNRVETLQAYLKNMPDDKVVQSFDEIDRQKYSSETMTDFNARFSTNIMSQIRGYNGGDYFDDDYEKLLEVKNYSPEFKVMKSYVTRMGGCAHKNIDEATAALMYYLGRLAAEGTFLFKDSNTDPQAKYNPLGALDEFYKKNIVPEFKERPKSNKEGDTVA